MQPDKGQKGKNFKQKLVLKSNLAKETLSEFLGTFIMIILFVIHGINGLPTCWMFLRLFGCLINLYVVATSRAEIANSNAYSGRKVLGCGSVAQAVLSRGHFGGIVTINLGFAMAVVVAIYVSGGVSGGHINPAVSFAMCLFGRMKWFKLPFYVGAQFLGAFAGAATLFGIYYDGLMSFAGGRLLIVGENATALIFATYPAPYLSLTNAFADQVVATMFLLIIVFAVFDSRNLGVPRGVEPIVIGLMIVVIASSLGLNSGCAMNPARDLSPRLFTALAGWGFGVFTAGNNFWWIPVVGPLVGAVFGGLIYVLLIEIHHPEPAQVFEAEQPEDNPEKYELTVIM